MSNVRSNLQVLLYVAIRNKGLFKWENFDSNSIFFFGVGGNPRSVFSFGFVYWFFIL